MPTIGTLASIHRYPVKSMQGDEPAAAHLGPEGLEGDRAWALRDVETGKVVSAKRPRPWASALECRATQPEGGGPDDVVVTLPDGSEHGVHDPTLRPALEALFGRTLAVDGFSPDDPGTYDSEWPEIEGLTLAGDIEFPNAMAGGAGGYVDVGVLHVLSTSAMRALAAADPDLEVDVRRFRPTLLLDTPDLDGIPDDDWEGRTLRIGDEVVLALGGPAPRCIMTTLAQPALTAPDRPALSRQPAVLRTIAAINRIENPFGTFACLGAYAEVARPGTVRVGDELVLD